MKTLFIDCGMGAAGDMLMAALLELLPEEERGGFIASLNGLGIPGVRVELKSAEKCGIRGSRVCVTVHGEDEEELHGHEHGHGHHHHASLPDILAIINSLRLPGPVRDRAAAVYETVASAEARVHGREPGEVHFHEVGAMDAVADVAGVCLLVYMLAPERIVCSPLRTGFGQVRCAHGVLPVPAPATALLLEGIPAFAGDIAGEMTTPTGAALVGSIAGEFGNMPAMKIERVGYGMGSRDFPAANCVRAVIGEGLESAPPERDAAELFCTIDDMTAEDIAFACETLMEAGALDVYTAPVGMKKGRPGTLLCCMCAYARRDEFARLLLRHTSTLGVRVYVPERYKLSRTVERVETPLGELRVKRSNGFGVERRKPEFDDLARMARGAGRPVSELRRELDKLM